jgi:hypothetical protein
MSKTTNDWLLDDLEEIGKRSLIYRYLQNPFSITWSKLTALVQAERFCNQSEVPEFCQSEYSEWDSFQQQHLYPRFTDRIDPSVYYCIFFPHQQFL